MSLTFTILGCGSSMGVPRVALGWGACDPNNPKNRRRRCSLVGRAQRGRKVARAFWSTARRTCAMQLLDAEVDWLDGVLITHEHADHTHGIDDLRPLFVHKRRKVDVYLDEPTSRAMHARFGYCFMTPPGSEYPPIVTEHRLEPGRPVSIDGQGGPIEVTADPAEPRRHPLARLPHRQRGLLGRHQGRCRSKASRPWPGLNVWIVDALRKTPHPSHFHLDEALDWIARIKPKRAILTNLHTDMDYARFVQDLARRRRAGVSMG